MRIGPTIIEDGCDLSSPAIERKTVRGIIFNEQKEVLMVYSHLFDDYTFPGGGIKFRETKEDALRRELLEELGAIHISIHSYLGYTEERRFGLKKNEDIYQQMSSFYMVTIHEMGEQQLIEREKWHGLEPRWIRVEDAIIHNERIKSDERHQQKGLQTVMKRELMVLYKLKEMIEHEKI